MHEVGDDFGIGIGGKFITRRFELSTKFFVVLDDAVMHDRQAIGNMRVGIAFTGGAVRGPAGVGNPGFATQMLFVGLCR